MDGVGLALLLAALGLLVVANAAVWLVLLQVVQQQGRILLRLDDLGRSISARSDHPAEPMLLPVVAPPPPPPGLPVGSPVGDFRLPDLAGRLVSPEAWRGRRTLLVHWNTTCGYCELIAAELARLDADLSRQQVRLVLASYGDAEANRRLAEEYGLRCQILLQPATQPIPAFAHLGTPVAYALDETTRISEPLAIGADPVLDLARRLAADGARRTRLPGERPLSESRLLRTGLPAGSRAPSFDLPDVQGGTLSLDRFRGQKVLLVFTDPHCGPCQALSPDLVDVAARGRAAGLAVVAIGRGDLEENRHKAAEVGFAFPMVVQPHWEVSRAFGIFATPVAYLIDEHGMIVRDVAMGREAILALAAEGLSSDPKKELEHGRAVR